MLLKVFYFNLNYPNVIGIMLLIMLSIDFLLCSRKEVSFMTCMSKLISFFFSTMTNNQQDISSTTLPFMSILNTSTFTFILPVKDFKITFSPPSDLLKRPTRQYFYKGFHRTNFKMNISKLRILRFTVSLS